MPPAVVGRNDELALARNLVDEAPRASAALLIVGEAGIGKTTLADRVAELAQDWSLRLLRGGCAPLSADIPYAPLQGLLRERMDLEEATGVEARARTMARLDVALTESGPGGPGQATVLVVEDAHWADLSTLGYLSHLTRNLPPAGLLVVMTYRPDGADETHDAWLAEQSRCPSVTSVPLGPLTQAETVDLVRSLAPDTPPETALSLHVRSGGNPYLVTELVGSPTEGDLPATLRQVLRAQLTAAGDGATRVVAAAGAMSRPAGDDVLLAAVDGDQEAVHTAYDRQLLARDHHLGAAAARPRHPVLAEVAYGDLLADQRRELHARLAFALEAALPARASAARIAEVAEQHLLAGHADDTLNWSVSAAEAAAGQHAYAEAGRWYARAVTSWPAAGTATLTVPPRTALADLAGRCLALAGAHEPAVTVLTAVLEPGPASVEMAPLLIRRGWSRFVLGATAEALADLDQALALLGSADDDVAATPWPTGPTSTGRAASGRRRSRTPGGRGRWPPRAEVAGYRVLPTRCSASPTSSAAAPTRGLGCSRAPWPPPWRWVSRTTSRWPACASSTSTSWTGDRSWRSSGRRRSGQSCGDWFLRATGWTTCSAPTRPAHCSTWGAGTRRSRPPTGSVGRWGSPCWWPLVWTWLAVTWPQRANGWTASPGSTVSTSRSSTSTSKAPGR